MAGDPGGFSGFTAFTELARAGTGGIRPGGPGPADLAMLLLSAGTTGVALRAIYQLDGQTGCAGAGIWAASRPKREREKNCERLRGVALHIASACPSPAAPSAGRPVARSAGRPVRRSWSDGCLPRRG